MKSLPCTGEVADGVGRAGISVAFGLAFGVMLAVAQGVSLGSFVVAAPGALLSIGDVGVCLGSGVRLNLSFKAFGVGCAVSDGV